MGDPIATGKTAEQPSIRNPFESLFKNHLKCPVKKGSQWLLDFKEPVDKKNRQNRYAEEAREVARADLKRSERLLI